MADDGGAVSSSTARSRFTYKQLNQLQTYSTTTPLRVISHVDLDGFYAQCETVRLGLPQTQPLAVQQWEGLIAINYAAKACGLTRFFNIEEAKKKCPELICQHVATWKEGEDMWSYHDDEPKNIATMKACLDPYRAESRKIMACIKRTLPPGNLQRVEKGGIDEVFLDLSAHVHSKLLERYPELALPPPYNDPTEQLPLPPSSILDWGEDYLVDFDESESEEQTPDWDDVAIMLGNEIVRTVRAAIFETFHYTTSAGISRNKMLSKLGSAHKKPNRQVVIRTRAIPNFLAGFDFQKIRNLGGKFGDEVEKQFQTSTVEGLLGYSLDELRRKLGDESGSWLYNVIRGTDRSEVNPRTQIKSMLSAKSFRPSINSIEQARRWLVIFVSDIFNRLVEEGVLENKRRPKSMHLHHRHRGVTRSKSVAVPRGMKITKASLLELAEQLMHMVISDGPTWPCANLMLSVGGFEEAVSSNGLKGFLVTGEEAKALAGLKRESSENSETSEQTAAPRKKQQTNNGISRFLTERASPQPATEQIASANSPQTDVDHPRESNFEHHELYQSSLDHFFCPDCKKELPLTEQAEHADWHFARSLAGQDEDDQISSSIKRSLAPRPVGGGFTAKKAVSSVSGSSSNSTGASNHQSKGQTKLMFQRKGSS